MIIKRVKFTQYLKVRSFISEFGIHLLDEMEEADRLAMKLKQFNVISSLPYMALITPAFIIG